MANVFSIGDPMWPVSSAARSYVATPRVEELAQHRNPHPDYQPQRSVTTHVPDSALNSQPTPRLAELARPKTYVALPHIQPRQWDWSDWDDRINPLALKASASARVEILAEHKTAPVSFRAQRSVMWPVSDKARNAEATQRVLQLSLPRARTMINDEYDPYVISRAALRAQTTPRLLELCAPLPRKMTTK